MTTFNGTYGSTAMFASVALHVATVETSGPYDVHTVLLVLNGQHGEFDLRIEATDDDLEDHAWIGVAHRTGGVAGFRKVTPEGSASLRVSIAAY